MTFYKIAVWRSVSDNGFIRIGDIISETDGDKGKSAFRYDPGYLDRKEAVAVDPGSLPLAQGTFAAETLIHGVFEDSLPDSWGRRIMIRRNKLPRQQQTLPHLLILLQSSALGALVYSEGSRPPMPHPEETQLLQLDKLLDAAERFERGGEMEPEMADLLGAGSSPGGARPKAVVFDSDSRRHYIAKFPSAKDSFNVVCIEAATMSLAAKAGLEVPETRLVPCGGKQVLLVNRFDLGPVGRRHMISFQTLLKASGSYVCRYSDVLGALRKFSSDPETDSVNFFRQTCFNSAIDNTDDHLKNFWMIHDKQIGWRLSPAFDLNPDIGQNGGQHILLFGESEYAQSQAKLEKLGRSWGIPKAQVIVDKVFTAVRGWKEEFATFGVSEREIARFSTIDANLS